MTKQHEQTKFRNFFISFLIFFCPLCQQVTGASKTGSAGKHELQNWQNNYQSLYINANVSNFSIPMKRIWRDGQTFCIVLQTSENIKCKWHAKVPGQQKCLTLQQLRIISEKKEQCHEYLHCSTPTSPRILVHCQNSSLCSSHSRWAYSPHLLNRGSSPTRLSHWTMPSPITS